MMAKSISEYLAGKIKNERGSVLLLTYMVITSLLILGAAFLVMGTVEVRRAQIKHKSIQAFYLAEAGLEQAIYDLKQEFETGDQSWANGFTINGTDYGPDTSAFYQLYGGAVTYPSGSYTHAFSPSGANTYLVSVRNVLGQDDVWVRSTGVVDGVSQTLQTYLRIVNVSPWNNAIFGGGGASGTMVNGNVNIYGSVHILGNDLDDGDNAINLGGTAELVGNNYDVGVQGLPTTLNDKIPALPQVLFNGETIDTLNAELRVKKGLVSLSGNSSVGEDDEAGNGVKETVDGAFVTDGYGGTKGATNVHSDNGTNEAYDLGDAVDFPSLDDAHPSDPTKNFYQYFAANGLNLTTELQNVTPESNLNLGDCGTGACITMAGDGQLHVQGMVYVSGSNDVAFVEGTSDTFEYTGSGTILVTGDVTLDANIVTSGDDSYPNNIVAFMTPGNITAGASSQKDIMGLFYAESEVNTAFQSNLVGTIISNHFDFSGQVPSIFQVPEVVNNLPPGIIANENVWYASIVSWQKCTSHTAVCGGVN